MKFYKSKILFSLGLALNNLKINAESIKYHADTLENGTILHAFCWSFNTIKEKLPEIKEAGYSAIQTSPIQTCVVGNNGSKYLSNWYFHYQPVSYNIGNYQLGSEDEFKSLCSAANSYGIKIIVDAVLNHMTSSWYDIDSSLQNSDYFHSDSEGITDWTNRYQVTQRALLGLNDMNTQSSTVQQYVLNFLKQALADGASGFRYDAAKHIELPDDGDYGSNFWPTITDNGAEFQYGEILQDSISRDTAYAEYMRITASQFGYTLRDAISNNDFSVNRILNYNSEVSNDKLITWVESHDNYSNSECESTWLTNEQVKLAWALLAARSSTTPLFFSRPVGGGGSCSNGFPGYSSIGDEGDSLYKDDSVVAVNLFRNAMEGESEYLRNGNDSSKILMIERGTKGLVIINLNSSNTDLSYVTNLADGTYENQTNESNVFYVSGGVITGTLSSRSITVLYNKGTSTNTSTSTSTSTSNSIMVYFEKPSSWNSSIYAYVYSTSSTVVSEVATWPGTAMTLVSDSIYSISIDSEYEGGYIIFNDCNQQFPSSGQNGLTIVANGLYDSTGYIGEYENNDNNITIYYYSGWSEVYIHYQADGGSWTTVPGIKMTSIGNNYYKASINASTLTFVFNNGSSWDNNNENNYSVSSTGSYIVKDGSITTGEV